MLNIKRLTAGILALSMVLCICGFVSADGIAGKYIMFAVENNGYLVNPDDMGTNFVLSLYDDGTGYITMNDNGMELKSWVQEGSGISLDAADGTALAAEMTDSGIIVMEMFPGTNMYFAPEGADISGYEVLSFEEALNRMMEDEANKPKPDSKLFALYESLKPDEGIHLNYEVSIEKMDQDSGYDVHIKGDKYYSRFSLLDEKYKDFDTVTFFENGNLYTLQVREKTGILASTINYEYVRNNVAMMDQLYSAIAQRAPGLEYTEEEREFEGEKYFAEIYPAEPSGYPSEAVFLFDEDGNLAYYIVTLSDTLGESVYRIHAIDSEVDESLLDISDYAI